MKIQVSEIEPLGYRTLDIDPRSGVSFVADNGARFDINQSRDGNGIDIYSVGNGDIMTILPRASNVVTISTRGYETKE